MNLEHLKNQIEAMSKTHHIEILKILKKNQNVKLNENKSGVYVNLSFLPQITVDEVVHYVNYINDQENSLQSLEMRKDNFKTAFFSQ